MKSYLSLKSGATFFLGSSRTLVYHKDDVEIIYRHKMDGKKYRRDSNQSRPYQGGLDVDEWWRNDGFRS